MLHSLLLPLLRQIGQIHLAAGLENVPLYLLESFYTRIQHYASLLPEQQRLLAASNKMFPVQECSSVWHKGNHEDRMQGDALVRAGAVGCLILAGGQGTRLGFPGPKGTMPVTPIKEKSLFQVFAERTLAASLQAGTDLPLCIMTSKENHEQTRAFFLTHHDFGLSPQQLFFFQQEQLPLIDEGGLWQLEAPGVLAEGPNGNGKALSLFVASGIWDQWKARGIQYLNVISVDNVLADPFDRAFVGFTARHKLDAALKAVKREASHETMGVIVERNGHMQVVEYTELPSHSEPFSWSSTGMFCFAMPFVFSVSHKPLPLHLAKKEVEIWKSSRKEKIFIGKCEYFLFDVLNYTQASAAFVCPREQIYAPLKRASGDTSLETVKRALLYHDKTRYQLLTGSDAPVGPIELAPSCYYPSEEKQSPYAQRVSTIEGYVDLSP